MSKMAIENSAKIIANSKRLFNHYLLLAPYFGFCDIADVLKWPFKRWYFQMSSEAS